MMKACSGCSQILKISCFHKNRSKKDGLSVRCKVCNNKQSSKYRKRHWEQLNLAQSQRRAEIKKWIDKIKKSHVCVVCGNSDYRVLDFHHKMGIKEFNIADALTLSKTKIEAEMTKCELVCANCHRIKTFYME